MPPVSRTFTAKTVSFNSLMVALSRGESLRPTYEQASKTSGRTRNVWQTRTAGAHQNLHNPRDLPQRRRRDPALRPIETSFRRWRDASGTGHLTISTAVAAILVSFQHHQLLERSQRSKKKDTSWNVLREDRVDPPIHTEYFHHSGGTTTLNFIVNGAHAVNSLIMRSTILWKMVMPDNTTLAYDLSVPATPPVPPAHYHQRSPVLRTSVMIFLKRVAVEDVAVLTQAITTASRISS